MHSHRRDHFGTGVVLRWSLAATLAFVALELAAGFKAHSLALISDAGHNFTDALALLLAWFGVYLEAKPADENKTYGYHRGGVLSAFVNALALLALSGWLLYQSAIRLRHPQPVAAGLMMAVAALGLLVNGAIMLALGGARRRDVNIRAAFVHMLGDVLGSIAIIAGAIGIRYTGWRQLDPLLSIAIALLIVWTSLDIIRETLNILLEGLPRGIRLADVAGGALAIEGVLGVHDLHIWSLGSSTHALSCHVLIEDVPPSASEAIRQRLNRMLADRFHIHHTTIQFEHVGCPIAEGCAIPSVHDAPHATHVHDH